jgi:thiamine biosynthesis protein ThiI
MPSETSSNPPAESVRKSDTASGAATPGATPGATKDTIVLRVAEIFLKGRNRGSFFKQFVRNARRLVADLPGVSVESRYLRAVVRHPPALRAACLERLSRLFGLSSMSPATGVATPYEDRTPVRAGGADDLLGGLADAAIAHARAAGGTFKIETTRRDKRFPLPSPAISRELGGRVVAATGRPVNVREPDTVIHVEIGPDRESFVFSDVVGGPGGLPVGTAGKVGLLLSGGIDSPVAGWSMMRRGCQVEAIYFHSFPYTGDKTKQKVLDLARHLAAWHGPLTVHVLHFTEVQKALRDRARAELAVLLYRRMMMRAASFLAEQRGLLALATGENLGQVASQTLANLAVIEDATRVPVLRPLLTYDKLEIVEVAKRIGTFETSILPYDDCCTLFVPKHPATRARVRDLVAAERGLDVEGLAIDMVDEAERIRVVPADARGAGSETAG